MGRRAIEALKWVASTAVVCAIFAAIVFVGFAICLMLSKGGIFQLVATIAMLAWLCFYAYVIVSALLDAVKSVKSMLFDQKESQES